MFSVEEIHFEWDRTIKEVIAVQENLLVVTENNTVIYNEEDNTVYRGTVDFMFFTELYRICNQCKSR